MVETEFEGREVEPIAPAAGWIGGKKQLAGHICELIESASHRVYAEAFIGMGGVFLRRRLAAKVEAINDRDRDVANFFRILQRHYQAFMDMLKWQLTSRAEFERLAKQDPDLLTDLERAARFLYLQKLSFGGKVAGRTFGGGPEIDQGRHDFRGFHNDFLAKQRFWRTGFEVPAARRESSAAKRKGRSQALAGIWIDQRSARSGCDRTGAHAHGGVALLRQGARLSERAMSPASGVNGGGRESGPVPT
jgi:hypothetical protein